MKTSKRVYDIFVQIMQNLNFVQRHHIFLELACKKIWKINKGICMVLYF